MRSTFEEPVTLGESLDWLESFCELVRTFRREKRGFCHLVVAHRATPNNASQNDVVRRSMEYGRESGLIRSAVIIKDSGLALRVKQLAFHSGVYEIEKYIDASQVPDWEERAMAWLERGVDPDRDR